MTIGTDNAVPSDHPSDLLANAMNFDEAMNSTDATFTDRLGVSRVTWAGLKMLPAKTLAQLNALSAATYSGYRCVVTDLDNAVFISNGSDWNPLNGECTLSSSKAFIYNAPSGTVSVGSGTNITLTTALQLTHTEGCWLYLPAVTDTNISAGFWWVVMSSTTQGSLKGTAQSLPSNTPDTSSFTVTSTGAGTYTGNTSEVTCWSVTLPAGLLGQTRGIYLDCLQTKNIGSTSTAVFNYKLNTTQFMRNTMATTAGSIIAVGAFKNFNSSVQYGAAFGAGVQTSTSGGTRFAVDTSVATTLNLTIDTTTATDWQAYANICIKLRT